MREYESGRTPPPLPVLRRIAELTDQSIDWLDRGDNSGPMPARDLPGLLEHTARQVRLGASEYRALAELPLVADSPAFAELQADTALCEALQVTNKELEALGRCRIGPAGSKENLLELLLFLRRQKGPEWHKDL